MAFICYVLPCDGQEDASTYETIASTLCIYGHRTFTLLFLDYCPCQAGYSVEEWHLFRWLSHSKLIHSSVLS